MSEIPQPESKTNEEPQVLLSSALTWLAWLDSRLLLCSAPSMASKQTNSQAIKAAQAARKAPPVTFPEEETETEHELSADQLQILSELFRSSVDFRRAIQPFLAQAQQDADRVQEELKKLSPEARKRLLQPFLIELGPVTAGQNPSPAKAKPAASNGERTRAPSGAMASLTDRVLAVIKKNPGVSGPTIIEEADITKPQWAQISKALREAGKITSEGNTRNMTWHPA